MTNWVKKKGNELHVSGRGKVRDEPLETHDIGTPSSPLWVKKDELPMVVEAMNAIHLGDPRIDYDHFINLQRALCACTGCDIGFLHDVVWKWVCTQTIDRGKGGRTEERGIGWLEEKWRTFKTSGIGAQYIYSIARAFGFKGGPKGEQVDAAALWGKPIDAGESESGDQGDDAGVDGGAAGTLPGLAGAGNGPLPPRFSDVHLRDAFVDQHGQRFRFIPELGRAKEAGIS